jgi:hypothetical protein
MAGLGSMRIRRILRPFLAATLYRQGTERSMLRGLGCSLRDQSVLGFLGGTGYEVRDLVGNLVHQIADYGVIIAQRSGQACSNG